MKELRSKVSISEEFETAMAIHIESVKATESKLPTLARLSQQPDLMKVRSIKLRIALFLSN